MEHDASGCDGKEEDSVSQQMKISKYKFNGLPSRLASGVERWRQVHFD